MNKICYGCGVKLQMDDSSKAGYTPKEESVYCQNCFKQMHYGVHKDDSLPKDENVIISAINKEDAHTLFLTDFYNINNYSLDIYKKIKGRKTLVISKCDILPRTVKWENIRAFIKEYYKINDDIIFINKSLGSTKKIINYLEKNNIHKTYLLGISGSGKSTLVNNLIKETNSKLNEVVTSYRTNTTKDFIRLELTNKLLVIDSPGFASISLSENNKDTFKYAIKPRTYQMRKRETLNIIDERFINFENETSVTLYIPNNVKSHKDYKQKAFSYDIHVPANSDLIIIGTGFMNIKNETDVSLFNIDKKYIEVRPSIFK